MNVSDLAEDPFRQLGAWLEEARTVGLREPDAMALATVGATGTPSVRMVLLRGWDESGFRFFTNYQSQKGLDLEANPMASLLFYWDALQRQVRVDGEVSRLPAQESDAYFDSRPRESQLGAWASMQSRPIESRETGTWSLTMARRIRHDGNVVGVASVSARMDSLARFLAGGGSGGSGSSGRGGRSGGSRGSIGPGSIGSSGLRILAMHYLVSCAKSVETTSSFALKPKYSAGM